MHVQLQVCQLACCPVVVRQLVAGGSLCVQEAGGTLGRLAQRLTNQVERDDTNLGEYRSNSGACFVPSFNVTRLAGCTAAGLVCRSRQLQGWECHYAIKRHCQQSVA
jgi:hypothetical protein